MNHRMILGQNADAAETAALTLADERADERIIEAQDWEHDERMADLMERRRKKREEKRRNRAIKRVKDAMGIVYADVLDAYLHQRTWRDLGIPKRTFGDRLKKVKIFLQVHE